MPGVRERGKKIRDFILTNITESKNFAALTSQRFGISLPAVYKHVDRLVSENLLTKKSGRYSIQSKEYKYSYKIEKSLGEDAVWEKDIKKHFVNASKNVKSIWVYGFLEIFNNAIEHSKGKKIQVTVSENAKFTAISIADDGIGIFSNIKKKYKLADEKDALLELAKGKRTTDTARHSGQGIFFTSKIFDDFRIISSRITFASQSKIGNQEEIKNSKSSTFVYMRLKNSSNKKIKTVFDKYSTEIPGDFDKTIIPIHLANSSDLVSRSQARRILSGLELFKEVILDFKNIEYIGQAFADEIFRVFPNMNLNTAITAQNANLEVQAMIHRAKNTRYK